MIKLKDILKEDEISDKFGNVAFGENPRIAKIQSKKREKDTEFEENLLYALIQWSELTTPQIANQLYNNFPLLKRALKRFPDILQPSTPIGTEVYRGIESPNQKLIDKLKKTKKEDWTDQKIGTDTFYKYSKPVKYTPRNKVQSWTSSIQVSISFARSSGVILSTIQNDEFLFNQNFIEILPVFWNYESSNEKEILHFGEKFKNKVYVIVNSYFWNKHLSFK